MYRAVMQLPISRFPAPRGGAAIDCACPNRKFCRCLGMGGGGAVMTPSRVAGTVCSVNTQRNVQAAPRPWYPPPHLPSRPTMTSFRGVCTDCGFIYNNAPIETPAGCTNCWNRSVAPCAEAFCPSGGVFPPSPLKVPRSVCTPSSAPARTRPPRGHLSAGGIRSCPLRQFFG